MNTHGENFRPQSPQISNWGRFGDEDELGTLNYLSTEAVLRGVGTVQRGERFPLNLPIDVPSQPDSGVPWFKADAPPYRRQAYRQNLQRETVPGLVTNDDAVAFATQASSQWDALVHVGLDEDGVEGVFYNGFTRDIVHDGTAERLGIDRMATVGIVGRGILIDIARHVTGDAREPLPLDHIVSPDQTERCTHDQGVEILPGDIVCFRTGWAETFLNGDATRRAELFVSSHESGLPLVPGISADHAAMAQEQRWAAVAADNAGVESLPLSVPQESAHVRMMRNLGLAFGELLIFDRLAEACGADDRWEFLFVAVPMWIPGGMGSPANAIAIR